MLLWAFVLVRWCAVWFLCHRVEFLWVLQNNGEWNSEWRNSKQLLLLKLFQRRKEKWWFIGQVFFWPQFGPRWFIWIQKWGWRRSNRKCRWKCRGCMAMLYLWLRWWVANHSIKAGLYFFMESMFNATLTCLPQLFIPTSPPDHNANLMSQASQAAFN